jgi:hypothetical protein
MYTIIANFIDEEFLKTRTPLNGQVDIKLLVPFIEVAQDTCIQPILGTALYTRLMKGIRDNDLNNDEIDLLKIIGPAQAYFALWSAIPFVGVELRGSGVVRSASPQTQPASRSEMDMLIHSSKSFADFYAQRIIDWLCKNGSLYPEFRTETAPIKASNYNDFSSGIFDDTAVCWSCGKCNCSC